MATRDLSKNDKSINRLLQKIPDQVERRLARIYSEALDSVRLEISRLYETYRVTGEFTKAEATRFIRMSGVQGRILETLSPYIADSRELVESASMLGFDQSFFRHAWAIDQASGVSINWSVFSDDAVRAAAGIGGDVNALADIFPKRELEQHARLLDKAFRNFDADTRAWVSRVTREGIMRGDSVPKLTRRLNENAIIHSKHSAEKIARTETLRAVGMGNQATTEQAADNGVRVREIWDATLDMRTRPEHAELDGQERVDGVFQTAVGPVPGPRRSGVASFDINCRCDVVKEVEDYAPSVRRIRGEEIQPYTKFDDWAQRKGLSVNRYGQKYNLGV